MTHQEIGEKLKEIIVEVKNAESEELDIAEVQMETNIDALGINSISFIKIIAKIESVFDIEFDDDDLYLENEELSTLGSFVSYIEGKITAAA